MATGPLTKTNLTVVFEFRILFDFRIFMIEQLLRVADVTRINTVSLCYLRFISIFTDATSIKSKFYSIFTLLASLNSLHWHKFIKIWHVIRHQNVRSQAGPRQVPGRSQAGPRGSVLKNDSKNAWDLINILQLE